MKELNSRPATAAALLGTVGLLLGACAGQPGGEATEEGDTIGADTGAAAVDTPGVDTVPAPDDTAAVDTLAPGVAGDTSFAARPPAAADTVSSDTIDPDSAWIRMARGQPDTAVAGNFFVRVVGSSDPRTVAEGHGVEPIEVVTDEARAFYAELRWGQVASLARDTLVRSLAQQIEGPEAEPPPIRGLPVSDTSGG